MIAVLPRAIRVFQRIPSGNSHGKDAEPKALGYGQKTRQVDPYPIISRVASTT